MSALNACLQGGNAMLASPSFTRNLIRITCAQAETNSLDML